MNFFRKLGFNPSIASYFTNTSLLISILSFSPQLPISLFLFEQKSLDPLSLCNSSTNFNNLESNYSVHC
ncbi:hypothetical protein ISN45_At03g052100 [Arabidopsis thaliana x Arabidopsis arenosa]|jgi:hypothetical protein|uniref:Uncharacterized protein n=1 Tax=Arabidopsis thaliana x Arabidopsis arenosa TaxID=1240361 RepID=A0A8T2EYL0_9BRAS|nr:hypothetical protein ISN45_At03g052100 [Arabidopsis thaliana x Arabidopsis arenosa]